MEKKGKRKEKVLILQCPSPKSITYYHFFLCLLQYHLKEIKYWEICIHDNVMFGNCSFGEPQVVPCGWSIECEVMAGRR